MSINNNNNNSKNTDFVDEKFDKLYAKTSLKEFRKGHYSNPDYLCAKGSYQNKCDKIVNIVILLEANFVLRSLFQGEIKHVIIGFENEAHSDDIRVYRVLKNRIISINENNLEYKSAGFGFQYNRKIRSLIRSCLNECV